MNFCIIQTVAILRLSGTRERNEEHLPEKHRIKTIVHDR
jgi:hypothetical protein